jgi:chorismate mutase/prephenate dehydratase
MADIKKLRDDIDKIDEEILALLNERAEIVLQIGKLKEQQKLEIYDPSREDKVCRRLEQKNKGPFPTPAIKPVFREIMSASLSLEKPIRVAYLGPKATFTHLACLKKFGLSAQLVSVRSIEDVFWEVERNRTDYGVVPVENSREGIVSHTLDMFVDSDLHIWGEILVRISLCLLSKSNQLEKINKIYSHRQPIAQARRWLRENMYHTELIEVGSTAEAAEEAVADPESAAIASDMAAKLYDLNILKDGIEDSVNNYTRFLIIKQNFAPYTGKDKTSIMFSIKDRLGALYTMLQPFYQHQVNLTKIESRPSKKKIWEYIFYVDMQGHVEDANVKTALDELAEQTLYLKILGSYPVGEID